MNIIFPYCALAGAIYASIKSIGVEADEDVEVNSVQDPGNPGVALLLQEEGGKLQHHLVERNHNIEYYVIENIQFTI